MNKRTSSLFRVDEQAWLTMGAVCLIALVILAFRFGTHHPCYPIRIVTKAPAFSVGSPVSFTAETKVGHTYDWNFGDGATSTENDPVSLHTFNHEGKYTVVVTIDGQCSEMQLVTIGEASVAYDNNLPPQINCSDTAYVGVPATYEDANNGSSAWAWRFDGPTASSFSRRTSHIWLTAGPKTIFLMANNRGDLTRHRLIIVIDKRASATPARQPKQRSDGSNRPVIVVNDHPAAPPLTPVDKPKEPEKAPEVAKAPPVSEDKLQAMLFQVVDGTLVQDDFAQYICNNMNMPVVYNGAKTTFTAMCQDLKTQKRKKIKKISIVVSRSEATNCILQLDVNVEKKKSFLGL